MVAETRSTGSTIDPPLGWTLLIPARNPTCPMGGERLALPRLPGWSA